jgi:hypothetical protein
MNRFLCLIGNEFSFGLSGVNRSFTIFSSF